MKTQEFCIDCSQFYHYDGDHPTNGICLNDNDFKPFLEDLLEKGRITSCRELYNRKKYDGYGQRCDQFEKIISIDISELTLEKIEETKGVDRELLENLYYIHNPMAMFKKDSFVDSILETINTNDRDQIGDTVRRLGYLIRENDKIYDALVEYFRKLSPAENLDDIEFKIGIIEILNSKRNFEKLAICLIEELYKTRSTRTTRRLIQEIFKILSKIPLEIIENDLRRMLREKIFSHRLKKKMKDILGSEI